MGIFRRKKSSAKSSKSNNTDAIIAQWGSWVQSMQEYVEAYQAKPDPTEADFNDALAYACSTFPGDNSSIPSPGLRPFLDQFVHMGMVGHTGLTATQTAYAKRTFFSVGIIEFVEQLREVDTSDYDAIYNGNDLKLILRPDEAVRCLSRDEVLAEAPESIDGYFAVPDIMDSKDS